MNTQELRPTLSHCPGCELSGYLYDSDDVRDLGQDMMEVRLPIGVIINAGWYPESDPAGKYVIKVWGTVELPESETSDVYEAMQIVQEYLDLFSGLFTQDRPRSISESESYESKVYHREWTAYQPLQEC